MTPDDSGTRGRIERFIEHVHGLKNRISSSYSGPIRIYNCTPQNLQHTVLGAVVEGAQDEMTFFFLVVD